MSEKYYSLKNILKEKAKYNIIIGERSNGKSYSVQEYAIDRYLTTGKRTAMIRRWEQDYKGQNGKETFGGIIKSYDGKKISKMSKGLWNSIKYYSSAWYLCKIDEESDKVITDTKPFCCAFALTAQEHYKSTNYDDIDTVIFEEFLTRGMYLPDEFITFTNLLSTIIRDRDDVTVFMLANTVNKYAPYFKEMGLTNINKMKQGTIDVYEYGDSGLKVAVEYCASTASKGHSKKSDVYFAFDNPKLKMITQGDWELEIYPHLPYKYKSFNIKITYFIVFNRAVLQCEIIKLPKTEEHNKCVFTYIHRKTTELKNNKKDIVFQEEHSPYNKIRRRITAPTDEIGKYIYSFFKNEKVFYQDNEIGEIVRNYIMWCQTQKII